MNGTLTFLLLLPRNVCVVILRAYRAVVSPLYGDVCRYYPSCSAYALQAIQQRGVLLGIMLGSRRIARCHPWAAGGIDDVPVRRVLPLSQFGFVLSRVGQPATPSQSPPPAVLATPTLVNHGKA